MLIVIEGGDAVGKQTQTTMLAEKLNAARFAFPNYESPTGKLILAHLKKEWFCAEDEREPESAQFFRATSEDLDARVFQSLQTVNRLESLPDIQAAIAAGKHVVMDRYWQSACVYGALDGLDEAWLRLVQEKPMPPADVNILIDVPVEEGFKRRPERRDRYETNRPFLEKVRTKYLEMWGIDDLNWFESKNGGASRKTLAITRPGWWVVDGRGSIEETHSMIVQMLTSEKLVEGVL